MKVFKHAVRKLVFAAQVAALLAGGLSTLGCEGPPDEPGTDVEQVNSDIINGTPISTDTVGTPNVTLTDPLLTKECSGTVIKSDWLLTAHHCVTQNALQTGGTAIQPGELQAQILNGPNSPTGLFIARHPTMDVALVKLTAAPMGVGQVTFPNWIYLGSDLSLASQSFFTQGWGENVLTECQPALMGTGAGVLRWANLAVGTFFTATTFDVMANASGQIASKGDSGSSLYAQVRSYERPIGVADTISNCSQNPLAVTDTTYARSDAFRGWFQGVVGWGPRSGSPTAYERSDGVSAVTYIGSGGHIKELNDGGVGTWHLTDFTTTYGFQPAKLFSLLSPYVRTDGVNAVLYEGVDSKIYEFSRSASGSWSVFNISGNFGTLPLALGSPTAYVRADNTSAVLYVGVDNHVHEMRLPSGGSQWLLTDLSLGNGAPAATGIATGYVRADGLNVVVYTTTNGHIIELSLGSSGIWSPADLTMVTGAPTVASSGGVRPYTREDNYSDLVYRTSNGHIWEMFLYAGGGGWGADDLTMISGCPVASSDPSPSVRNDNWSSVLFVGTNNHINEIGLGPGANWVCNDLTAITSAPTTSTVPEGYVSGDRLSNVIMTGASTGHIWNIYRSNISGWGKLDLTAASGGQI